MINIQLVLGITLMVAGVGLVIAAIVRSLDHRWTLGVHELWLLPVTGVALMLAGRWLIQ